MNNTPRHPNNFALLQDSNAELAVAHDDDLTPLYKVCQSNLMDRTHRTSSHLIFQSLSPEDNGDLNSLLLRLAPKIVVENGGRCTGSVLENEDYL